MNKVTYYAFSDESYGKKYEGLGMISLPFSQLNPIENKVRSICENDISKIKWNKIKGYDKQSLAFKIMEHIIQMALEGKLRVDVLIWDKTDSRHNINFDIPWTYSRLEQRIGRVNRLGSDLDLNIVVNMLCKNTIDETIYKVVYRKKELADLTIDGVKGWLADHIREVVGR